MGSKNRLSKHILPIILKDRTDGQHFVDVMCGGGNLCQHIEGRIIANDVNKYVIAHLKHIQNGGLNQLPKNNKEFTKQDYIYVKNNKKEFPDWLLGHVGFNLSFGGKWFGGWCQNANRIDYVLKGFEHAQRQSNKIKNIQFKNESYLDLEIPENSIIYCDPPYEGTTKYKDDFNHDEFWQWCRDKAGSGYRVFISEYNAPEDFECIWTKEVNMKLDVKTNSNKRVEKLFILN